MKKLLATIALAFAALSINAQTVPQFTSEEEVYMYAKYNNDTLLWNIFHQTETEIKNSINFADRYAAITLPYQTALETKIKHLEDSLGVSRNDASGDKYGYKLYNPNADTAKVRVFIALQYELQQECNTNVSNATKDIQTEYYHLFEQALVDAVNRYFQNAQNVSNQ